MLYGSARHGLIVPQHMRVAACEGPIPLTRSQWRPAGALVLWQTGFWALAAGCAGAGQSSSVILYLLQDCAGGKFWSGLAMELKQHYRQFGRRLRQSHLGRCTSNLFQACRLAT